jgi:hypothetical protein
MRRLALALPLALLAACTQDPPGRCDQDLDCLPGQICTDGLCLPLVTDHQIGSLCARDTDCVAWGECLSRVCELRPGACEIDGHCDGWEVCTDHACTLAPNGCPDEASCQEWQDCVAYRCETAPGRCVDEAGCEAWQDCGTDHFCATAPGFCATTADCHVPQVCDAGHVCFDPDPGVVPDPDGVLLFGTVHPGTCARGAIANLAAPDRPLVGSAACNSGGGAFIGPAGEIVYLDDGSGEWKIRTFVRDSFRWDDVLQQWEYPAAPAANDGVVSTPACDGKQITGWVMQGGTGSVLYACGTLDYFDGAGAPATTGWTLHAWNANGLKLASAAAPPPVLLDAAGSPTAVTGLPAERLSAWRTHLDGFRVVLFTAATEARGLYEVASTGVASLVATYAPAPGGFVETTPYTLAANGDLYVVGTVDGISDVVVRLTAVDATVVYDEANGPDLAGYLADWLQDPLTLYTFVEGDRVIGGP